MRESCTYGSVRGASSNGGPYRDRREFITLLGGAAAALAAGGARAAGRADAAHRRALCQRADDPEGQARVAAFLDELQQLGWTDGRNVRIDIRWA